LLSAVFLLLSASVARAQDDTIPKKRLRSPATVRSTIGGESHDSYVIKARRGQRMTVSISWRKEGDNEASFTVNRSSNFFSAEAVGFGKGSNHGRQWSGKIPETGNYYIYVTAHPVANYLLRVRLK
jgi:hypothetical protein